MTRADEEYLQCKGELSNVRFVSSAAGDNLNSPMAVLEWPHMDERTFQVKCRTNKKPRAGLFVTMVPRTRLPS